MTGELTQAKGDNGTPQVSWECRVRECESVRGYINKTKYFCPEGQQFSELMEARDLIKTVSREASEVASLLPGVVNYLGTKIEQR